MFLSNRLTDTGFRYNVISLCNGGNTIFNIPVYSFGCQDPTLCLFFLLKIADSYIYISALSSENF